MREPLAQIRSDLQLLKWGQVATLAGTIAILVKLFLS
jgi:hypothetical protein